MYSKISNFNVCDWIDWNWKGLDLVNAVNTMHVVNPSPLLFADSNSSLLSNFCLCDYEESPQAWREKTRLESNLPWRRKSTLLISIHKFDLKAETLLKELIGSSLPGYEYYVQGTEKSEPKPGPICDARSIFIGVSRNGKRWQSLIHINKIKNYISTYNSEREAAISFDLYCILLKKSRAKTNFSYTKDELIEMIYQYRENGYSI